MKFASLCGLALLAILAGTLPSSAKVSDASVSVNDLFGGISLPLVQEVPPSFRVSRMRDLILYDCACGGGFDGAIDMDQSNLSAPDLGSFGQDHSDTGTAGEPGGSVRTLPPLKEAKPDPSDAERLAKREWDNFVRTFEAPIEWYNDATCHMTGKLKFGVTVDKSGTPMICFGGGAP